MKTISALKSALESSNAENIRKVFNIIESSSPDINGWQKALGLPLEPHSYKLAHQFRNRIANGIGFHFGLPHLDKAKFPALATIEWGQSLETLAVIEDVRSDLTNVYRRICAQLYGE